MLDLYGYTYDPTLEAALDTLIFQLNCVVEETGYYFSKTSNLVKGDQKQILIVPYRSRQANSNTGFSVLEDRLVFISSKRIKDFVRTHSLSDSLNVNGYLSMVLLHELGHIVLQLPSGTSQEETRSQLGEQRMDELEPQVLTAQKRNELKIDSLAITWVEKSTTKTKAGCFDCVFDIQLALNGAEFIVFGLRKIENFGSPNTDLLIDPTNAHPNFELRLAFMNYYLNPSDLKREMIDNFLYNRIEGALWRQGHDPRVNQSREKFLIE